MASPLTCCIKCVSGFVPASTAFAGLMDFRGNVSRIMNGLKPEEIELLRSISGGKISQFIDMYRDNTSVIVPTNDNDPITSSRQECYCGGILRESLLMYRDIHGYCALLVCLMGTAANVLNVAVLTRRELAAAPINRILTWLAVADMLVMLEYIPVAIYMYMVLPDSLDFSYSSAVFLLFHMHFSLVLHSVSVCLTITLAVWRYISIRYPERARVLCTQFRCQTAIIMSYLLPLLACMPQFWIFSVREKVVHESGSPVTLYHVGLSDSARLNGEIFYHLTFWLYSVVLRLVPCVVLTVLSCWLVKTLYRSGRRHAALTGGAKGRRAQRTTRMLVAVLLLFLATEFPSGLLGLLSVLLPECFFMDCYKLFGEVLDMLALCNGAINFILYCFMSRQFRTTFSELFCPRLLSSRKLVPTSQTTQTTCV